jgi:hypothetical protein
LVVLDITDPTKPVEVGFFDTYPLSNSAAFNGAWGTYPFLPSGNILVNDINSGLYIVADKTLSAQGSVKFSTSTKTVNEGDTFALEVERLDGAKGAVDVYYETQAGNADVDKDYAPVSGKISWAEGDTSKKTISIPINADTDTDEFNETFFVRLFNPRNGLTLSSPSIMQATINGKSSSGTVQFETTKLTLIEGQGAVEIAVRRPFGEGELQVDLALNTQGLDVSNYIKLEPTSLHWAQGDTQNKSLTLTVSENNVTDANRVFTLTASNKSLLGAADEKMEITVKDKVDTVVVDGRGSKKSGGGILSPFDILCGLIFFTWLHFMGRRYGLRGAH